MAFVTHVFPQAQRPLEASKSLRDDYNVIRFQVSAEFGRIVQNSPQSLPFLISLLSNSLVCPHWLRSFICLQCSCHLARSYRSFSTFKMLRPLFVEVALHAFHFLHPLSQGCLDSLWRQDSQGTCLRVTTNYTFL